MAAVLALVGRATGTVGAVLSHRSAAELWGLLPAGDGPVDVSLPSRSGRRRRPGIRIHRPMSLEPAEMTRRRGIPVTSPARTLADLPLRSGGRAASRHTTGRLPRAADWIRRQVGRNPQRARAPVSVAMPSSSAADAGCEHANRGAHGRLLLGGGEAGRRDDGYRAHRGRAAFEDDRARDLMLRALGYEVQHLSYRQVFDEADRVAAVLRAVLTPTGRAP